MKENGREIEPGSAQTVFVGKTDPPAADTQCEFGGAGAKPSEINIRCVERGLCGCDIMFDVRPRQV
jgi:hypothetical protein